MPITALSALLLVFGLLPAVANTLTPPPNEIINRSQEQTPADMLAQPQSTPGEAAAAESAPPVLLAAIPWSEPTDEEQPAPLFPSIVPPPPPPTPAELLGLVGKERAKAERCLANAVYFEARGEPLRGQVAVAQVVLNRVFSPYYPNDVCSVVYQNADRHLACQFTFACDGKSKAINDRRAWWRAQRVARLMLDGKVWLAAVAKSTHYHANYVSPAWTSEMRKMYRYGVHLFYRPYRWGDGEKELGWVQAPLPVLKSKAQSQPPAKPQASITTKPGTVPEATSPKMQTANATPSAAVAATTKAAAGEARADNKQPKADGKQKPTVSPQAKDKSENAAAKPATKRAKPPAAQRQAGSSDRVLLN